MSRTRPTVRRVGTVAAATAALTVTGLVAASAAFAHVTVASTNATQGGYATLTFKVPTESDTASTVALAVSIPTDHPIASVSVQPKAGWTFTVKKSTLATPITTDDGPVTEAISEIDWKADSTAAGIAPGEFDLFNVSAGPLPDVDSISFPAIQTYSDGSVVKWIEQATAGSAEPEHPAPTLTLAAATTDSGQSHGGSSAAPSVSATAAAAHDDAAASKGSAITGIVLGALGLVLGAVALLVALRRKPTNG